MRKNFKIAVALCLFMFTALLFGACSSVSDTSVEITNAVSVKVNSELRLTAKILVDEEDLTSHYELLWDVVDKSGSDTGAALTGRILKAPRAGTVVVTVKVEELGIYDSKEISILDETPQDKADAFKVLYGSILEKTVDTIRISDRATLHLAEVVFASLDADVRALLTAEKAHLDALTVRIEELESIVDYREAYGDLINTTIAQVKISQKSVLQEAIAALNELSNHLQDSLSEDRAHFNALLAEIVVLEAIESFLSTHSVVLNLTINTVAIANRAAVEAAILAFNGLNSEPKARVADKKVLLDGLLAEIVVLEAIESFLSTHSVVLNLTVDTVAIANRAAVEAAILAFNGLNSEPKARLADKKELLDELLVEIGQLEAEATPVAPTGLTVSSKTLSWQAAQNAESYEVSINGNVATPISVSGLSYDLSGIMFGTGIEIKVRSVKGNEKSDWSSVITVDNFDQIAVISFDPTTKMLSYEPQLSAESLEISVVNKHTLGGLEKTDAQAEGEMLFDELSAGYYTFTITAVGSADFDISEATTFDYELSIFSFTQDTSSNVPNNYLHLTVQFGLIEELKFADYNVDELNAVDQQLIQKSYYDIVNDEVDKWSDAAAVLGNDVIIYQYIMEDSAKTEINRKAKYYAGYLWQYSEDESHDGKPVDIGSLPFFMSKPTLDPKYKFSTASNFDSSANSWLSGAITVYTDFYVIKDGVVFKGQTASYTLRA